MGPTLIVACGASITICRRKPELALAVSIVAIAIYTLRDYEDGRSTWLVDVIDALAAAG